MADTQPEIPPAKGQSAPAYPLNEAETTPTQGSSVSSIKVDPPLALSEGDRINVSVTPASAAASIAKRWTPDLDQIEGDINKAIAILPPVTDPPPLVKDFESPVFWTTTVLPIALAVVAYVFHHDLSSQAVSFAGLGAAITTLGYTIYRGIYRHAHSQALTTASALRVNQNRDAAMLATTGHIAA